MAEGENSFLAHPLQRKLLLCSVRIVLLGDPPFRTYQKAQNNSEPREKRKQQKQTKPRLKWTVFQPIVAECPFLCSEALGRVTHGPLLRTPEGSDEEKPSFTCQKSWEGFWVGEGCQNQEVGKQLPSTEVSVLHVPTLSLWLVEGATATPCSLFPMSSCTDPSCAYSVLGSLFLGPWNQSLVSGPVPTPLPDSDSRITRVQRWRKRERGRVTCHPP